MNPQTKSEMMLRLKRKKGELEKDIAKQQAMIDNANVSISASRRKIREIEHEIFVLDEFYDMPMGRDAWELYDMKGANESSVKIAAEFRKRLRVFRKNVTGGKDPNQEAVKVYNEMHDEVMKKYSKFGAVDTEPRGIMMSYIEKYAARLGYPVKIAY